MVPRLLLSITIAFLTAGAGASATEVPEVTVTAPKPPDPQQLQGENVPNFIKKHAKPSMLSQQLGRWFTEICPLTVELTPGMNDFVTARLQAIAASVGAPHQWNAKCRPNVGVYFTPAPQKLLDEVVKQAPQLLGFHYPHQTQRLASVDRPIQAWYVTALRGVSGADAIDDI